MITFYRGETKKITIALQDPSGNALDITGYQDARVAIGTAPSREPYLVKSRSQDGSSVVEVQEDPAEVSLVMTADESDALPLGVVEVQAWVKLSGAWSASYREKIKVAPGMGSPHNSGTGS